MRAYLGLPVKLEGELVAVVGLANQPDGYSQADADFLAPFISTVGWVLPTLVSGEAITSIVLSLPTTGPLLIRALMSQDMYLAGSFILMLSVLTVIGTLVSDLLLAWLDPRIRLE